MTILLTVPAHYSRIVLYEITTRLVFHLLISIIFVCDYRRLCIIRSYCQSLLCLVVLILLLLNFLFEVKIAFQEFTSRDQNVRISSGIKCWNVLLTIRASRLKTLKLTIWFICNLRWLSCQSQCIFNFVLSKDRTWGKFWSRYRVHFLILFF